MQNRKITELRNLGPRSEYYLSEIGINDEKDLREAGYMAAYVSVKTMFPRTMNLMALYAIYGAITGENCIKLSKDTKERLKKELEEYTTSTTKP